MKPQDIEIVQSVLEITGPINPTEVYDKAKELFEKGEITIIYFTHQTQAPIKPH
ncbi:hypothetical protein [Helicobacter pylori]|uniref:hypothetical protein n=1 Tax=Helicobacter pylori TaxID=210 RepID=UPI0013CE02EE|nr:hypothetical protein [Helicobacter pylori]